MSAPFGLRVCLLFLVLVLSSLASSCTSGQSGTVEELTSEEESYLTAVAEIESEFFAAVVALNDALGRVYNTPEAVVSSVNEAGFGAAADVALERARILEPPSDFIADHELWLEFRSGIIELDLQGALDEADLVGLLGTFTDFEQSYGELLSRLSSQFCRFAARDARLCPAGDDLAGGEYGRAVHAILRDYQLSTLGLFIFSPGMSPEERSRRLDQVQPGIEEALKTAGEALSELEPPAEFADEHAAYVQFFEDQYRTAVAITEANAAGDDDRILQLFAASGENFDRLESALSPDFRPIAAPFFAGDL